MNAGKAMGARMKKDRKESETKESVKETEDEKRCNK